MDRILSSDSYQKRIGFGTVFRMPGINKRDIRAGYYAVAKINAKKANPEPGIKAIVDKAFRCTYFVTGDDARRPLELDFISMRIDEAKRNLPDPIKVDERTMPNKKWRKILPEFWRNKLAALDRRKKALERGLKKELENVRQKPYEELPVISKPPVPVSAKHLDALNREAERLQNKKRA